jgi:hypothetical protein
MTTPINTSLSTEMQYILECINSIEEKYYTEEVTRLRDGVLFLTGELRANESTYVTQLINKIESKFKEQSIHIDKHYQTDLPKQLIFSDDNYARKYNQSFDALFKLDEPEEAEFFKVPDIVIHSGPNDFNPENQIFLSEVKTTLNLTQKLFNIDLFKLNVYHEELYFQNSAFIIINSTIDDVKTKYSSYKASRYYQTPKNGLFIIVKPSFNDSVEILNYNEND